jgi:SAM-dependent methyltransferase
MTEVEDVPQIAAEIGRQMARLGRALANIGANAQPVSPGALRPPFGNSELSDWVRAVQLWREHGTILIQSRPRRACPACGGVDRRFLFYSFDQYPYVDCLACGTWYVPLVVDEQLFDEYYEKCPEAAEIVERLTRQRLKGQSAEADRIRLAAYFAELEPLVGPRNFLDVGCGVGHALEVAAERGWTASGLDTSPSMIAAGRERGLRVFHPKEVRLEETFGLVSLWETLEHINHPLEILSGIVPLLRDDGLLSITVPSVLALEAPVMRQDVAWINGGPGFGTVHINLFRPSSLEHLLTKAGLQVVGWDGEYGSNINEIVSYVLGRHRGAWDYARGAAVDQSLSDQALSFLNWVAPAWAVLARQLLLAPVLKVIASKSQDGAHLASLRTRYAATRRTQILAALDASYPQA